MSERYNRLICSLSYSTISLTVFKENATHVSPKLYIVFLLVAVKSDKPSNEDLESLAKKIPLDWRNLGRRLLQFDEETLDAIDSEKKECCEKAYKMLLKWKQSKGSDATYRILHDALCDAELRELAERFCLICHDQ